MPLFESLILLNCPCQPRHLGILQDPLPLKAGPAEKSTSQRPPSFFHRAFFCMISFHASISERLSFLQRIYRTHMYALYAGHGSPHLTLKPTILRHLRQTVILTSDLSLVSIAPLFTPKSHTNFLTMFRCCPVLPVPSFTSSKYPFQNHPLRYVCGPVDLGKVLCTRQDTQDLQAELHPMAQYF